MGGSGKVLLFSNMPRMVGTFVRRSVGLFEG